MKKSRAMELTPAQRTRIDKELDYLEQRGVEGKFEEYLAANEFTSADHAGGLGALSGLFGGASILLALAFGAGLSAGFKIYLAVLAMLLTAISFWAMRKNTSRDAPRRAAAALCQWRASAVSPAPLATECAHRAATARVAAGAAATVLAAAYLFGAKRKGS